MMWRLLFGKAIFLGGGEWRSTGAVFYHNVKQTVSNICATISGWHLGRRRFSEEGAGAGRSVRVVFQDRFGGLSEEGGGGRVRGNRRGGFREG